MSTDICPECSQSFELCPPECGVWECAFQSHLANDCTSERGLRFRQLIKERKAFRDSKYDGERTRCTDEILDYVKERDAREPGFRALVESRVKKLKDKDV